MKNIFIFIVIFSITKISNAWEINFSNTTYQVFMDNELSIPFNLTGNFDFSSDISLEILSDNENLVVMSPNLGPRLNINITVKNGYTNSSIPIKGVFLGKTRLILTLTQLNDGRSIELPPIEVKVVRRKGIIDKVFAGSVGTLVALIYVNFGCALNWSSLKTILKRPIGPIIGFFGQFGVMPTLSYVIGLLVFPEYPELRLGLFFTGISPAGGASNIWTVILEGNVDLSVTMTTLSTLAAFFMMPLWLFTLGPHIFAEARLKVPYGYIASLAAALILPLGIGWAIQRFLPRVSKVLVRFLKGFSAILILFIIVFAIATHLYLFQLATWKIVFAGLLLPWCGFTLGGALAFLFKQPQKDITAIAIETGVQNTGIAIFLLRFILPNPEAELTTIIPVAIACMTPIPLALLYIYKRCVRNKKNTHNFVENAECTS